MVTARWATAGRSLLRTYSSATVAPPPAVSSWINDLTSRAPSWARDTIDWQRVSHLQKTLPTRSTRASLSLPPDVRDGDALAPGHHLILFQPQTLLDDVGADGSSTEYNPPAPYLRRMWAGGSFEWSPSVQLRVGEPVTETTRVSKVEFKKNMVFVYQEKVLYPGLKEVTGDDWAVKEIRTHVFRTNETATATAPAKGYTLIKEPVPKSTEAPKGDLVFSYIPTSPLLFRYSALTFNGHKIHYDRDWVREKEGHPDLVVHGPLTATLLVELASRLAQDAGRHLARLDYRATASMYVDREIVLTGAKSDDEGGLVLTAEQDGRIGMKATASLT